MAVGDCLLFVVQGLINSQVWQTTHFYRIIDQSGFMAVGEFVQVVQSFANWYQTNVHANITTLCTASMTWNAVKGYNLFNEQAVAEVSYSPPLIGSGGGEALAQFNAYGFTTPSQRRRMNAGKRRMPGVVEGIVGAFGEIVPSADAAGALVSAAFSDTIDLDYAGDTKVVEVEPVIVKRVRSGEGTDADPYEYRLPLSQSEFIYYNANSWSLDEFITTQNSRKTGRGV